MEGQMKTREAISTTVDEHGKVVKTGMKTKPATAKKVEAKKEEKKKNNRLTD